MTHVMFAVESLSQSYKNKMEAVVPYVPAATSALSNAIINNPEATKKLFGMAVEGVKSGYKTYTKKRKARPQKKAKLDSVPNTRTVSYQEVNTTNSSGFTTIGRKTLFATPLRLIEPPNENNTYGASPGNVYHLNGFRWCAKFLNTASIPIRVHVHFVQPVRENITVSDIPTNMFIDNRSLATKYSDFVPFSSVTTWDPVQDCFKLNRRKFNILKSMDFYLNGQTASTDPQLTQTGSSWKVFDQYFKCNTTFEYENTASSLPMKPIWMLVYFESVFPSVSALSDLNFNTQTIGYVRDNVKK